MAEGEGAAPPRRWWLLAAQVAIVGVVLWFAGTRLAGEWSMVRDVARGLAMDWSVVALSGAVVLVSYAILIETWRRVLASWGSTLRWRAAAHIWFVSSLGRYVPGKVWQIGAMAALAQRAGVSPVAATGSSILVNLVNLLAGVVVMLATGVNVLRLPGGATIAIVVLAAGLLLAPLVIPWAARLASRLTGRDLNVPRVPLASIFIAFAGCVAGWALYGIAFYLLARGTLGAAGATGDGWGARGATGGIAGAIAVYTASYLAGYIVLVAPGGIGVREVMMTESLVALGFSDRPHAAILAVVSRLWITVLEILPGVIFLAQQPPRAPDSAVPIPAPTDGTH